MGIGLGCFFSRARRSKTKEEVEMPSQASSVPSLTPGETYTAFPAHSPGNKKITVEETYSNVPGNPSVTEQPYTGVPSPRVQSGGDGEGHYLNYSPKSPESPGGDDNGHYAGFSAVAEISEPATGGAQTYGTVSKFKQAAPNY